MARFDLDSIGWIRIPFETLISCSLRLPYGSSCPHNCGIETPSPEGTYSIYVIPPQNISARFSLISLNLLDRCGIIFEHLRI
jgi:hypothetical protein